MKNRIIVLQIGIVLIFFTCLFAHGPDTLWTKTYGGYAARSVLQKNDEGFIFVDYNSLVSTDAGGNLLWQKGFGGYYNAVQRTSDKGYIIAGYCYALLAADFLLVKTDSLGDTLWTNHYPNDSFEIGNHYGHAICITTDYCYVIAGSRFKPVGYFGDVYMVKADSLGNFLWEIAYGDSLDDEAYAVIENSNSQYLAAGYSVSEYSCCGDELYIVKATSDGNVIGAWSWFGHLSDEQFYSISNTSDGGYIAAGFITYDWNIPDSLYNNVLLMKFTALGNLDWMKCYGDIGWGWECGYSVEQTFDGGYIIVGETDSYGAGAKDVYLIRTDSLGDTLWTGTYGGPQDDVGYSVKQTTDGGYIIGGYTETGGAYLIKTSPLNLVSPNGGETLFAGSMDTIKWHCDYPKPNYYNFRILLSTDGGSNYSQPIAKEVHKDSTCWIWRVLNLSSTTCRIKVEVLDSLDNMVFADESDSNFTITQTGIEEDQQDPKPVNRNMRLTCQPNPFTTYTSIYLSSTGHRAKNIELHIYEAGGRLVKSIMLETNTCQVGADLVPGVYFLKLNGKPIGKVVKVR